jgi:hypothetical protein
MNNNNKIGIYKCKALTAKCQLYSQHKTKNTESTNTQKLSINQTKKATRQQ